MALCSISNNSGIILYSQKDIFSSETSLASSLGIEPVRALLAGRRGNKKIKAKRKIELSKRKINRQSQISLRSFYVVLYPIRVELRLCRRKEGWVDGGKGAGSGPGVYVYSFLRHRK